MKLLSRKFTLVFVFLISITQYSAAQAGSYMLFNPAEIKILPNSSKINSASSSQIVIGKNKKLVYVTQGRTIEMWGLEERALLHRFTFENAVRALTDDSDSLLLVLEEHEDLNELNIRMHLVNLLSGSVTFLVVPIAGAEEFILINSFSMINESAAENLLSSIQETWPWQDGKSLTLFESSVSTDNQEFVLLEKHLLNLKTLESCTVPNFSNHALLNNKYLGLFAELYTQNYWSEDDKSSQEKNTCFVIKDIRPNGDTLAISPRFKLRVKSDYYQSEIFRSSTSRFVWAFVNEFFQETQRDLYIFDIQTNLVRSFPEAGLSSIDFSSNDSLFQIRKYEMNEKGEGHFNFELYLSDSFKKVDEANTSFFSNETDKSFSQNLSAPENSFDAWYLFSSSTNKYFGFYKSGKMFVWNKGERSPFETVYLGDGKPIHCSFVGENILVVLESREAFFINPRTNKVVCTVLFTPNNRNTDILWYLPNGSFYAPKNSIAQYHMVKGLSAYPLLTYEVLLNRPDQIVNALGVANTETVEAFRLAYKKRINRFKKQALDFNTRIPNLRWKSNIPQELKDSLISFSILLDQPSADPLTAHVLINGVPIYGMKGIQIEGKNTEFSFTAALENGKNEILVYIQSKDGINSFPISKEINCTYSFQRRLFFAGIGVSSYIDSTKNLTFAHSDVLKLEAGFQLAYGENFSSQVLTNERASKNPILDLKNFLKQSHVNDIVVVAFAGHGTIGSNNEFYFCPTDMDFSSPEKNGVSYAEIENLLDSIPARKKLLLLDACHSGEIDSSFAPVFVSDLVVQKDTRGIDVILTDEPTNQKEINFLVESLFSNLNNGTGAYVISASAGSEYAYETEQTGGVFTYSFLESFKSHFYSYNSDASISILQQETYQKVTELTKGAQRPTTRAENTRSSWKFEQ